MHTPRCYCCSVHARSLYHFIPVHALTLELLLLGARTLIVSLQLSGCTHTGVIAARCVHAHLSLQLSACTLIAHRYPCLSCWRSPGGDFKGTAGPPRGWGEGCTRGPRSPSPTKHCGIKKGGGGMEGRVTPPPHTLTSR